MVLCSKRSLVCLTIHAHENRKSGGTLITTGKIREVMNYFRDFGGMVRL